VKPLLLAGRQVVTVAASSRFLCAVCRGWAEVLNVLTGSMEPCPHCALGIPIAYPPMLPDRFQPADQEIR
jgi:hypothetical protein